MAPRLSSSRRSPSGFPRWPEFGAISVLVLWLVGVAVLDPQATWIHLLLPLAFSILGFSLWQSRTPRGDA